MARIKLPEPVRITPAMVAAGEHALLSSFSDEYLSWRAPGLEQAVCRVYRAMHASSALIAKKSAKGHHASSQSVQPIAQRRPC
jgi:hypothetical protein